MQISAITLFKVNKINPQIKQNPYVGKLAQLTQDTVSFSGKNTRDEEIDHKGKVQGSKKDEISKDLAKDLNYEAEKQTRNLTNNIRHVLSGLVINENNPDRIILPGKRGIHGRAKDPDSIAQKSASTILTNKADLKENMKDLAGVRIVLNKADRKSVDKVIQQIIKAVNNGYLIITEIENYRPSEEYSYVSEKSLQELYKACSKKNDTKFTPGQTVPSGYTALHLTAQLKNGYFGEIQIMGRDVEQVKEIEDILYKIKNHKALKPKYKHIEKELEPYFINDGSHLEKNSKELEEFKKTHAYKAYLEFANNLNDYTTQLYKDARKIEPYPSSTKTKTNFRRPTTYDLAAFDFNELYKAKTKADKNAEK